MNAEQIEKHLEVLAEAEGGIPKLRELILQLAVMGRLVEQDPEDEDADALLALLAKQHANGPARRKTDALFPIPDSWAWARFDQVAAIRSNLVDPAGYADYAHIAPNHIEKGSGRLLPFETVAIDKVHSGKHKFYPNQILYSKIRPALNKVVLVDFHGLCSADIYPIEAWIDARYLKIFMLSNCFLGQVTREDNRVAMPKVNQEQLSAVAVAVPPLAEQARIVAKVEELLARCDELEQRQQRRHSLRRAAQTAALDALAQASTPNELARAWDRLKQSWDVLAAHSDAVPSLRQAILQLGVQGRLVKQDREDDSAAQILMQIADLKRELIKIGEISPSTSLAPIADTEQPYLIPATWRWARLGDIYLDSFYGPRFGKEEYAPYGIPTIRTTDMTTNGEIILRSPPMVQIASEEKLRLYRLRKNDLLVTRSGTIGMMAVFRGDYNAIPSAYLIRFRFPELVLADFYYLYLKSPYGQELLGLSLRSIGVPNVNATSMSKFAAPLPPLTEQKRIVAKVEELMTLCDELERRAKAREEILSRAAQAAVAVMTGAGDGAR